MKNDHVEQKRIFQTRLMRKRQVNERKKRSYIYKIQMNHFKTLSLIKDSKQTNRQKHPFTEIC